MTVIEDMLLRQAIELSAVIGDHSETLKNLTVSFMKSEFGIELSNDEVGRALDREATARLFFACGKSKPEEIRNPQRCLRLARDLWLDYSIVISNQLTSESFMREADVRFCKEKELYETLGMKQSPLSGTIKKIFSNPEIVHEYKRYLQKTVQYFQAAFYVLEEYFSNSNVKQVFDLYNPFFSLVDETVAEKTNISVEATEDKSKSKIKYLEKSIHELRVKLEHLQKDAMRDIAMTLASTGFGAPLFELYAIRKDENTPEHIVATISNLFLALESLDIRISNDSLVGKTIVFEELKEGKFCLNGSEVLESSDSVIVKYPGLKLGKETIVKPTIMKEK